ncbi:MAG: FlgD immunoglobulin-like domain containing protein [Candidatus Eisenbacteria bacterium]
MSEPRLLPTPRRCAATTFGSLGTRVLATLGAAALTALAVTPASAIRVASYNLLNYTSGREAQFRVSLGYMDVDVLFVEEILSQAAVDQFRTQVLEVLNPGEWAAAPFVNGPDTDSGMFYRTSKVQFVDHVVISTALRDIDEYTFRPVGYDDSSANIRGYVVHLKASQGSTEEQQRLAEVQLMRARMETFPAGQNYFITGDFNIYTSTEPAYAYMLSTTPGTAGVVQDPIAAPGNWHNNGSFASIHTQSPRTTQFGGGANGGLDDRFDMLLVSPSSMDGEGWDCLPTTYRAVGQDGLHFNLAVIDNPPNQDVPQEVAQALHDGSDHLPLMVDFQVPPILETVTDIALGPVFVGGSAETIVPVSNAAAAPADELDYFFVGATGFVVPAGSFTAEAEETPNQHIVSLDTGTAALYADAIQIVTDDPDEETRYVAATGAVFRHAVPSLAGDAPVTEGTIDFGTQAPGPFPSQDAVVFNLDYDAIQGLLDVYDAELTGDPRFAFSTPFDARQIGDTPEAWSLEFDGVGAPFGVYEATLVLHTRDQQDIPGALGRPDLAIALVAEVSDAADVYTPAEQFVTRLHGIEPNPFAHGTDVVFSLAQPSRVSLAVYDAGGRALRVLAGDTMAAGEHRIEWDGRDDLGRELGAGIYFLRLTTPAGGETKHVVKIR